MYGVSQRNATEIKALSLFYGLVINLLKKDEPYIRKTELERSYCVLREHGSSGKNTVTVN